jgi:hypothetical protein
VPAPVPEPVPAPLPVLPEPVCPAPVLPVPVEPVPFVPVPRERREPRLPEPVEPVPVVPAPLLLPVVPAPVLPVVPAPVLPVAPAPPWAPADPALPADPAPPAPAPPAPAPPAPAPPAPPPPAWANATAGSVAGTIAMPKAIMNASFFIRFSLFSLSKRRPIRPGLSCQRGRKHEIRLQSSACKLNNENRLRARMARMARGEGELFPPLCESSRPRERPGRMEAGVHF